jgi:hypothetical protein
MNTAATEKLLFLLVVAVFFRDLFLLFTTSNGLRHLRLRNAKHAFGFVPAIFVRKLCDTFSSLHDVAGSDQPTATLQALIKTHRTHLQICNPALKRGILRGGMYFISQIPKPSAAGKRRILRLTAFGCNSRKRSRWLRSGSNRPIAKKLFRTTVYESSTTNFAKLPWNSSESEILPVSSDSDRRIRSGMLG